MRFDLADLRLFVNVVDAGSITGGAARLNLALAAASTRIGSNRERPATPGGRCQPWAPTTPATWLP